MSSVGSYLRERREVRGVSLKEMARATRVRERYLEALEADEFSELPAGVFTKGFIRACCQVLSEPPDEALRIYSAQLGLPATLGEPSRPPGLAERGAAARCERAGGAPDGHPVGGRPARAACPGGADGGAGARR